MSIKGMSEEVVSALEFDPFVESKGTISSGERPPPPSPTPAARGGDSVPITGPAGRDPASGRFTPAGQPVQQGRTVPAAPTVGRDVGPDGTGFQRREAQGVPTPATVRPDEGGTTTNSVEELMNRVKEAGPIAQPVPQAPMQQTRQPNFPQYDYSKPWPEQNVNLPAELLDAIFHEDRDIAAQGMSVLVNTMYNALASEVHMRIAAILHQVPQYLDGYTSVSHGQQALRDKFYSAYPHLATQQGMSTVYTIAQNVAALYANMGQSVDPMSDDFIRYVGEQAERVLGVGAQPKPAPRRQFQTGGGTRDGGGIGGNPFMEAIGMA